MDPREEYRVRRERWLGARKAAERLFIQIGNWRLFIATSELLLLYLFFGRHLIQSWLLAVPVVVFVLLAAWHARVLRRQTLADRALRFYDRALARIDDKWIGTGSSGDHFRDASSLYAEDLDIFGQGSLFQLVSDTRTTAGEAMLANWLLAQASNEEASKRQAAIIELRNGLDLREDLGLLGADIQAEVHVNALHKWGTAPLVSFPRLLRWVAPAFALVSIACLFAFFAQAISPWLFLAILGIDLLIGFALRSKVLPVLTAAESIGHGLRVLAQVLARLEREEFSSPRLQSLTAALKTNGKPASTRVADLARWIDWLDSGDHTVIRALRPLLLWREQIAMGLERWRQHAGESIAIWLSAVAEFEALSSLASLAFERPNWCFPELLTVSSTPQFTARNLRHPLLPAAKSVGNDLSLDQDLRLLILSGSNMSGKSTLLRTVGLGTVLAWAGGPVPAESMTISRLHPGASIRVSDSVLDNRSRFLAEITRIRSIVEAAHSGRAVVFLLDELLSGTNSHDRRIGAGAILRKLVESGAVGIVTTHDLALTDIVNDLCRHAANVHLQDHLVDGQMIFDYRLRPGIVTHSNALELMRAIGLEV